MQLHPHSILAEFASSFIGFESSETKYAVMSLGGHARIFSLPANACIAPSFTPNLER
jgi:hypothetical protein